MAVADTPAREAIIPTIEDPQRLVRLLEEARTGIEEVLRENQNLRASLARKLARLEALERLYKSVEIPRLQERLRMADEELSRLRAGNEDIRGKLAEAEDKSGEFAERCTEVERQYSHLVQLYVASYRLHASLDLKAVLASVEEVMLNMIGVAAYAVYVSDHDGQLLRRLVQSTDAPMPKEVVFGEGPIGRAAVEGELICHPVGQTLPSRPVEPIALVPLIVGNEVVGVIAVTKLLTHKQAFAPIDVDLFQMLSGHGATALQAALACSGRT